ncbi:MAG: hypothetical protein ABIJ23_00525 [Candidatus Magasanikbacteria bacterium]
MKTRKKFEDKNIRKLTKMGGGVSYGITLPVDVIRRFKWKERQKLELVIDEKNQTIKISDWKKK